MSKIRSPRYPQIGLKEAIERVRAVYEEDHTNTIPKDVVAQHMGYKSLNGASLGVISAVSKYGLLEGGATGGMRVTDRALTILAGEPGDPDRSAAIQDAARAPGLFQEIFELYPNGVSDQSLKSFLLTKKKFLPAAAEAAIRAYRGTEELVRGEGGEYDSGEEQASPSRELVVQNAQEMRRTDPPRPAPPAVAVAMPPEAPGPNIAVSQGVVRMSGSITNQADAEYVIGLLTAVKAFLPSAPKPEKEPAPADDPDPKGVLG